MNVGERIFQTHIERLPEGVYLATSDDVQGLIAQGRTVAETIDILLCFQEYINLPQVSESFDYPLIV